MEQKINFLNSKNISITEYFINILDLPFKSEIIDNEKIKNFSLDNIIFQINKELGELFCIFSDDFIIFSYEINLKIYSIITLNFNKFSTFDKTYNLNVETLEDKKIIQIKDSIIEIYFTQNFNYSLYQKIIKSQDSFIFYKSNIYVYPLTFYKLFKIDQSKILNVEDVSFNEILNIVLDTDKAFYKIDNLKINQKSEYFKQLEQYFFIALSLQKHKKIELIINETDPEFLNYLIQKYIFYIIKIKNIKSLSLLLKIPSLNLNIINPKNGLNVFEYSLFKFLKDSSYYHFIKLFDNFNFQRSKFIFDIILKTNLTKHIKNNNFESLIYQKISKISKFENIEIINSLILDCMYQDLNSENNTITINEIIEFIKMNVNFINLNVLYNLIFKYSSVLVLKELIQKKILEFSKDILILFIKLKQTDYLIKNYKLETSIHSPSIIYELINSLNIYGIIFLIRFVNGDLINLKDNKGNNLLHYLTNQNILKDSEDYENLEFNVFKFLITNSKDLINSPNNEGNIPIINTIKQKNIYLFNLFLEFDDSCVKFQNKEGNYLIHELIKYNFKEGINYYIIKNYSLEFRDINQNTALLLAIKNKNQEIANDLIKNNADIEVVDIHNNSIFHYIALFNLNNIKTTKETNLQRDKKIINFVKSNIFYQFKKINFIY